MKFRLVIFDWDGTLMDSVARIVSSMQTAALDCLLPVPSAEAVRDIIGLSLYKAFPILFGTLSDAQSTQLLTVYRRHYLELDQTPSPLFAGASDTIKGLHASGYQLAVATGKQRVGLDSVLADTQLGSYFHALRGADQAVSKPHPLMLEQILDELQVKPAEAVMVGDSSYDLAMAQAIGMPRIGVTYGVHDSIKLSAHQPLALIDDIRHLRQWV
ncbi:HAD family hydrolase [Oceanisphaera profunda]|uniref:HAD family hydrolase n=1 Tax=Oceanisphaera profunda TaxID=1416627 RepID=A0A1Y0D9E1_9GAMM|nr:HAD-IA family hydrolase [Oceanisphaera profunda]ART83807.1 HAD family hydrolase [Oceanisphaera profunda]